MIVEEVVAGCILKDGKVYLAKRQKDISPECVRKFEFPGGRVKEGESYEEALVRELKEELDVKVRVIKLLHTQVNTYSHSGPFLVLFFLCLLEDENEIPRTTAALVYLKPEEVKHWDTLPGTTETTSKLENKYTKVLEKHKVEQPPEFTARVLTYELGDIHKLMIYIERFGGEGYRDDLKIACADHLTMSGLLPEQLGFNLEELYEVGLDRFNYRMGEVKKSKEGRQSGT